MVSPNSWPEMLGIPSEYFKVMLARWEALNVYRLSDPNWSYLSPSAGALTPGYRTGASILAAINARLRGRDHRDMSREDVAVALIEEGELPRHVQRRFTAGR